MVWSDFSSFRLVILFESFFGLVFSLCYVVKRLRERFRYPFFDCCVRESCVRGFVTPLFLIVASTRIRLPFVVSFPRGSSGSSFEVFD